ncbi:MAG: Acg family FMN-binding oxidoreductase [Aquabacterium sp.]
MPTRRHVVLGGLACGALSPALVACSSVDEEQGLARAQRRPLAASGGDRALLMQELVRYATLAPSSHNTQCWTFRVQEQAIVIAPDLARRCPSVDPDDHHLHVSLGCATENLAHAALAAGLQAEARFDPAGPGAITVHLEATRALATPLFQAIPERQCTRGDYDGRPVSADELRLLERAGTGNGVWVVLMTGRADMERVLAYVVSANTAQLGDAAFVAELKSWIRFSAAEAQRAGDGLFAGTTGSPALPRWLASPLMGLFLTPKSENERYARQVRNSSGIAVFASEANDKAHWIEAGRCYERFALQATALGLRNAFVNQPVEVGAIRPQFASALGLGSQRPDLVVRFGRGPGMPLSLRRPVQAVLL